MPIIVACADADEANVVYRLHGIFGSTAPDDAHSLAYAIDNAEVNVHQHDIYAVRTGMETGVYVGFNWYVCSFTHDCV